VSLTAVSEAIAWFRRSALRMAPDQPQWYCGNAGIKPHSMCGLATNGVSQPHLRIAGAVLFRRLL